MAGGVFRRKAYDALKEWKKRSKGSTAILVEGARRVGKTTLVREFAEKEYRSHIIVDFYIANNNVKRLFDDSAILMVCSAACSCITTWNSRKGIPS